MPKIKFLKAKTIGISISGHEELASLGFGEVHLKDAMVEIARHLLAAGATLAYGGDLRQDGFTDVLLELVRTHNDQEQDLQSKLQSYLAWPLHLKLEKKEEAGRNREAVFHKLPAPEGMAAPHEFMPPSTTENRVWWFRALTDMRRAMDESTDARIMLGGPLTGYQGKYPGLLEEASIAMRNKRPVYLIGAFGGCVHAIIRAVRGERVSELSESFQRGHEKNAGYADVMDLYNKQAEDKIDYAGMTRFFAEQGLENLNNGLTPRENEELFQAKMLPDILTLLIKGLGNLYHAD